MNKYFYPIYKMKLKPWIKYWLIKKTSVKPVSGTYTLATGASPLTILKALKAPIKDLTLYGDCKQASTPTPENPVTVQTITGQTSFTITSEEESTFSIIPLGSIELCKIGDYSDRIYKENDKWYLEKKIGKVVLNGSENWSLNAGAPSVTTKYFQSNVIDGTKMASTTGLCNRFLVTTEAIWTDNGEKMQLHNSADNIRMRINTSIASTVSELQTWLSSNNVTLYYVLAEATTTEITDNLLLTILNGLENLETFKGTNEITFSDLSPNISFEYLKEDEV